MQNAECSPSSAALLSRLFFFVMTSKTFYFHNCIHLVWMILDDCWAPSGIMLRHFMRLFRNVQIVQIIPERFETGWFTFFYSWLFWYRQFCPLCVIILWHKFVTSRGWSNPGASLHGQNSTEITLKQCGGGADAGAGGAGCGVSGSERLLVRPKCRLNSTAAVFDYIAVLPLKCSL